MNLLQIASIAFLMHTTVIYLSRQEAPATVLVLKAFIAAAREFKQIYLLVIRDLPIIR